MGERPLFGFVLDEHFDHFPHTALNLNHENLVLVTKKNSLTVIDRQDTPYLDRDDI